LDVVAAHLKYFLALAFALNTNSLITLLELAQAGSMGACRLDAYDRDDGQGASDDTGFSTRESSSSLDTRPQHHHQQQQHRNHRHQLSRWESSYQVNSASYPQPHGKWILA